MTTQAQQEPIYTALRAIPRTEAAPSSSVSRLSEAELISGKTGAQRLWMARMVSTPGLVSPGHHHGESEAAFYVLRGQITFFYGDGLRERVDLREGDSILIPAWTIHAEGNLSEEDDEVLAIRSTPEPIAFYLPELRVLADMLKTDS